ncbi:MAG: response regulator [candidate division KSB1 bacterium]|nr:response regulator [candidate division KSB1 bacterium]
MSREPIPFCDAEDNKLLRQLVEKLLQSNGYHVISAKNGNDAWDEFKRNIDRVHILIMDVLMPGLDGREVLRKVRTVRPGVQVLYTSGYSRDQLRDEFKVDIQEDLLQKPYQISELLMRIRSILDTAGGS